MENSLWVFFKEMGGFVGSTPSCYSSTLCSNPEISK
jgi:hypothetical protein